MTVRRGLRASVYRSSYGDCSNGGISSRVEFVTIVGPEWPEVFEPTEDAPAVEYVTGHPAGRYYRKFVPVEPAPETTTGYMASACYVGTSDSRFREITGSEGPLPLHDRVETWAEYEALSR